VALSSAIRKSVRPVYRLIATEAGKYDNIAVVQANDQGHYLDFLFVVQGDLWLGENAAFKVLNALAEQYPKVKYDFLVLPERLYTSTFHWGENSRPVYKRRNAAS